MTSREIRTGGARSGRAQDLSPPITLAGESPCVKAGFDRGLSQKIDCLVFLVENEASQLWLPTLRSYLRYLERNVTHAN